MIEGGWRIQRASTLPYIGSSSKNNLSPSRERKGRISTPGTFAKHAALQHERLIPDESA